MDQGPSPGPTRAANWRHPASPRPAAVLGIVLIALITIVSASVLAVIESPLAHGARVSPEQTSPIAARATEPGVLGNPHTDAGPVYGSVTTTLDLVDNRTLPGATQPATQDTPLSVVDDAANGDLYVRGYIGQSLTVVNGSTNTVVAEIAVPQSQSPYATLTGQTIDPVGKWVYVANDGPTSNLSIIDGTTNAVSGSIYVGGSPAAIVDDPANGDLYVSNWGLNNVNVVSTSTNTLVKSIPVGSHPGAILFDPTSNQIFVANWGSGNVSVIAAGTNTIVANIVTGTYPVALALDTHDDRIDVANSYNGGQGSVTVISAPVTSSTHGVNISVGHDPDALAYSPKQNQMFVANGGSANVSIINQTVGSVVATSAVGVAPAAAVFDPTSHDIYVLDSESLNITILNPASDSSIGNVPTDNYYAYGLAVEADNGNVVAVSEGSFLIGGSPPHAQANATVVSGITNRAIASVPLIVYPEGLTYDPFLGKLIVADPGGNDTYLVNTTTSLIGGTRPVGLLPQSSAFDSLNNEVYVLDHNESFPYTGEVNILGPNLQPIKNILTGSGPTSIAFDSANGKFYVTDNVGGNVTVLNGTTNKYNTTITIGAGAILDSVLYDPHNQEVYVGDSTTSQVFIINGTSDQVTGSVRVGSFPTSLAFDSRNNTIVVANTASGNASVIADSTNTLVKTFTLSYAGVLAYDSANNVLYNAEDYAGSVSVYNASTYASLGAAISLGSTSYPHGIVYDPANQFVYVSTEYQGSISIIPQATYSVTFAESGLPASTPWSVTLAGDLNSSSGANVGFREPNGAYGFTVGSVAGYVANVTYGSVHVAGNAVTVDIGFTATSSTYSVTFVEVGLPVSTLWNITLQSALNQSTTNSIGFSEPGGTYPFTVGRVVGYVANVTSGNVLVSTSAVTVHIGFTKVGSAFPVTFIESGLPTSTDWSVTFNHSANSSTTTSIGFLNANGTWPFVVGAVPGYASNVTYGNVTVAGVPQDVRIGFTATATTYSVTFRESGLPASTPWTVTLAGVQRGSSTTVIGFSEPDGSYAFTVGSVAGYSATPNSGSIPVAGAPAQQAIAFTPGTLALSVQLTVAPANITLGASTTLAATTAGGTPPFAYLYSGLPAGCVTHNTSSWSCTPTATGPFAITVTVTDSLGAVAHASATLNVSASPNNNSSPASSLGWEWILLAVVLIAAVLLILFVVLRRRRRAPPSPAAPPPTPPVEVPPPP